MIEVTDMKFHHVYELARNLREGDRLECEALGYSPKLILRKSYQHSIIKKSVLVEGKIVAAFGVTGSVLGGVAFPWLLTAPEVEKCYLPLVFLYRKYVKEMLEVFPRLENHCDWRYTKSLRLLKIVGFTVEEPRSYGRHGELFCKFHVEV